MKLSIKLTSGVKFTTDFSGSTVLECKQHLHAEHSCATPSLQKLVYKGRILDDGKQLESDYQIVDGSTLFLVTTKEKKAVKTPAAQPAATVASPAVAAAATTTATQPAANPLSFPPEMPTNLNDLMQQMSQMQPPAEQNGSGNPSAPNQDPLQAGQNQFLQAILNEDPEFVSNILQSQLDSNPALRELMDSNPMVREALQDPAALRSMMQAAAHPDVRAQQQRHHDLALANIENMPGGFNALRSMYENIQAPLEEAAAGGGAAAASSGTNSTSSPSNSTAGASGQAMPNPWGSSSSSGSAQQQSQNPLLGMGGAGASPFRSGQTFPFGAPAPNPFGGGAGGANPFGAGGLDPNSPEQRDAAINALESNPQLQQMMQQFATQQPGMIRQLMAASNPAAAQMMQGLSDEQLGQMMQMALQPNVLRMMQGQQGAGGGSAAAMNPFMGMNPAMMQGLMSGASPGATTNPFAAAAAGSNPWAAAAAAPANPAERYRHMLDQMRAMGFDDDERSLNALQRAHGNLNRAVDLLLEEPAAPTGEGGGGGGEQPSEQEDP